MEIIIKEETVFIDKEDFHLIEKRSVSFWYSRKMRIIKKYCRIFHKGKIKYLHRVILNASKDQVVDHINGNTLDNRKINLRFCTKMENSRNRTSKTKHTSKYKGVSWSKDREKWCVYIEINKKSTFLGRFNCEIEAALAYNKAALKYFKEFAALNEI